MLVGALFDAGVWYYVKDVQIFDDEEVKAVVSPVQPEMQMYSSQLQLDKVSGEDAPADCELKDLSQLQNNILNHLNGDKAAAGVPDEEQGQTGNKH